ncbi:hypothetical protein P3S67_002397 [Capsicum chacoense]
MMLFLLFLALSAFLIFLLLNAKKNGKNNPPPGPIGLPLIGNLHQFDNLTPHLYFWKLSKKYGKIFSLKFGSSTMVVVSSAKLAKEVLKTQDLVFCSRPSLLGQQKLSYNGHDIAFSPCNDYWREMRKICVLQLFSLKKVQSFRPIREDEVSRMIKKISQQAASSQNVLVAGSDTNAAVVVWSMTELVKNPKVMKKVQEEIRKSIGNKSIVNEDDIQNISYFKAVLKERFRLRPPDPLLLPRESMEKSTLEGYEIPPTTIIYINSWSIARDHEIWKNPEEFIPERFLNNDINLKREDYELILFGAGRRGCPGITLGIAAIELALSNLLYAFNRELPCGLKKKDIDTDVRLGITMHKKNELCVIPKKYF